MTTSKSAFVLVPGFWLGGWAWDQVASPLRAAGHQVQAATLPGLESATAPRAGVSLGSHLDAVTELVRDAAGDGSDRVVLVGHSGAGVVVHGVTDRVPDLIRRAVYVDSGPLPDGMALRPDLPPEITELPLPGWEQLAAAGSSLDGLSDEDLARFARRAVPHPAGPAREALRLSNPRRSRVPVTVITSSYRPPTVRRMAAEGHPFFRELAGLDVGYLDLPTGHWPMWSRPDDLAEALVTAAAGD